MSPQAKLNGIGRDLVRLVRTLCHAGVLVFGAFWLVATSAVPGDPRDCFTGIAMEPRLQVTLGTRVSGTDGGGAAPPSCGTLDGLDPGAMLTFHLSQPEEGQYGDGRCRGFETLAIDGTADVTVNTWEVPYAQSDVLTLARGTYSSSQRSGCGGDWWIDLGPETGPPPGEQISPFDAGVMRPWLVIRRIHLERAQACDGAFVETGPIQCEDRFLVQSIEVAP